MTPAEYSQLNLPTLSHPARSLYYLHLRRQADAQGYVVINYPVLGRALAVEDPRQIGGFSYQVNASQLTALLQELLHAGLLRDPLAAAPVNYHGCQLLLPLLPHVSAALPLAASAVPMQADWRPGSQFGDLAKLCGLADSQYAEDELGEFIAYWLGRPEVYATDHQWMLKFIKKLKVRRYLRHEPEQTARVGFQSVTLAASPEQAGQPSERALQMIDEARRLNALSQSGIPDHEE